jgi:COP9 signalosome complex subunit 2
MQNLRAAYDSNDLLSFERTLSDKTNQILADPFIMSYVEPLRRRMREQVLLALVRPYRRIRISFVADELRLSTEEVELLLVDMILDKRIYGKIDQINGFLLLGGESNSITSKKYEALDKWTATLESLASNLSSKVNF